MKEDIWKFIFMICPDSIYYTDESITTYYDKPILDCIDPNLFLDSLLQMSSSDKMILFQALPSRYESQKDNLIDELKWLKSIQKLLKSEAAKKN
ncbi:hypothetical protein HRE53_30130 (plasmid) [Acaryochloris sp. 'Moss Beach']|uniref:hypothetical protein n=1 Tax=Acaryochloris sp. 'Moss Beach' TaxID=2740837 RepID=UPI001F2002ED|nr:hypothetical protein [Acaryochloris sp. 'Moss Beach']UJB72991.1 hypothetical protein HRE53_30130 [Acaryochloris sp. 'Moss Beach']